MSYVTRKIKAASERNRARANRRWQRDRQMRAMLASIDPVRLGGVVRRIIVIDHESSAREIVFYAHDRYCDRKRKLAEVRALALPDATSP